MPVKISIIIDNPGKRKNVIIRRLLRLRNRNSSLDDYINEQDKIIHISDECVNSPFVCSSYTKH